MAKKRYLKLNHKNNQNGNSSFFRRLMTTHCFLDRQAGFWGFSDATLQTERDRHIQMREWEEEEENPFSILSLLLNPPKCGIS